jgi:hypothetical protein
MSPHLLFIESIVFEELVILILIGNSIKSRYKKQGDDKNTIL